MADHAPHAARIVFGKGISGDSSCRWQGPRRRRRRCRTPPPATVSNRTYHAWSGTSGAGEINQSRACHAHAPSLASSINCDVLSIATSRNAIQPASAGGLPTLHRPAESKHFYGFPKQSPSTQAGTRRGDAGATCAGGDDYPDPIKPALVDSRHPRRRAVWEACEMSPTFGGLGYRADNPPTGMRHVQLSSGWSLSCAEGGRLLPASAASVPGNVHLDLLRAGLIQDPRVGMGLLTSRWVRTCGWVYETTFDAPEEALAAATRRAWLVFQEIRGSAEFALNDAVVAKHDGGTRPCHVDVSGKLRAEANRLRVH